MPGKDEDLLARLNALKPSSVSISAPSIEVESSRPRTVEDKLEERLKTLRSSATSPKPAIGIGLGTSPETVQTSRTAYQVALDADPISSWQQQHGDEQTLEDLLAELGPDDQWNLDPQDPRHIKSVLDEAQAALPKEQNAAESHAQEPISGSPTLPEGEHGDWRLHTDHVKSPQEGEDDKDDAEADDYVKRVLAELEFESRHGRDETSEQDEPENSPSTSSKDLSLPSAPANLPESSSEAGPPSYEDSELEARFAKLGARDLGLPSTPTSKPTSAKPKVTASLKPKSNLPTYTDEDIDSWCCICNENGEVKCLGCDGDIYCHNCWRDGHGNGPGQERGHKAVQYNRRPPAAAA